jgi:hypothetical protein
VFVVGESVAALLGSGNDLSGKMTRGQKLIKKLFGTAAVPKTEIINCGMGGYESYRINGVLEEALKYDPDLLVVLSGNNDTLEESCPGFECELRRRKFRLYEKYFSISNTGREARKKAALKMHEAMLLKMAASAKKARVPIVFCTLPAAVKDMPPRQPAPLESKEFWATGFIPAGRRGPQKFAGWPPTRASPSLIFTRPRPWTSSAGTRKPPSIIPTP